MIQNLRIVHADERKVLEKQRERERARLLQERGKVAVKFGLDFIFLFFYIIIYS